MVLKLALVGFAVLAALVAAAVAIGALLPVSHVATRGARFGRPPQEVWDAINQVDRFPAWRPGLKRAERLPDVEGRLRWKEEGAQGTITFERMEALAPTRLVARIADPDLPFGGSWTYVVAPAGEGSTLTITERGEVYNLLFRFMSRFVFGHTATLDEYLRALGKKFGEDVTPASSVPGPTRAAE